MATIARKTTTIKFTEARQHLSELMNQVARQETRVLVEKHGIPVGAIVSPNDLEQLQRMDVRRQEEFDAFIEVSKAFADVSDEELEREISNALQEVRAEMRMEREQASRR